MTNSEVFKTHNYIKDFDIEIKRYWDSLQSIEHKLLLATEKDEFTEFEVIRRETKKLQKDFTESQTFIEYTKYITLLAVINAGGIKINRDQNVDAQHIKKYRERIAKEIGDIKQIEFDQKLREERAKLVDETKERIKQLEDTIAEETKANAQFVEKNKMLEADIEKQAEELKIEVKSAMDLYEQEKKNSEAKDQIMQNYNTHIFSLIYEKCLGSKISDLKTCSLSFNLSDSKQKTFFKEIESAKLRLPDIKRIRIDYITDGDADLNSFLSNCTPDCLQLFCLNRSYDGSEGGKADFYIEALCKTLKAVTNEVYIVCLKLTASDLEQIVKASSNSERLVIRYSDVSCSVALDFATKDKYKTKFMSFYNCGDSDRKSDFKSAPASFENIVEALEKSGLKDSLQTLEIKGCGLNKTAVQGLLSKHGMGAVSVVETGAQPME